MATEPRLLLIDDETPWHELIAKALKPWKVDAVFDGPRALEALASGAYDLVLLDRRFDPPNLHWAERAEEEGEAILAKLRARTPPCEVIVLTAYADVEAAVRCIRHGARDFAVKDRATLAGLKARIHRVLIEVGQAQDRAYLVDEVARLAGGELVGGSAAIAAVRDEVGRIGASDRDVLIYGETGTGKELVARALHAASARADRVLRKVNCATLGGDLLAANLFGIESGVATGVEARPGQFELADGGTLFLDEIGALGAEAQAMLLRVLENCEVERVGGRETRAVDVRVLAATNRPLEELVKKGEFREDLLYRVRQLVVRIPPLRERAEDIPVLVGHFLAGDSLGSSLELTAAAGRLLAGHRWPGNVRELKAIVLNACVYAAGSGKIGPEHLRIEAGAPGGGDSVAAAGDGPIDYKGGVARRRCELLAAAWTRSKGYVSRMHEVLGLPARYAVRRELQRLKRDHPDLCEELLPKGLLVKGKGEGEGEEKEAGSDAE